MATFNGNIAAGGDDVGVLNGAVFLGSSNLIMGNAGNAYAVALRFLNVTIPPGATIASAYVTFTANSSLSGTGTNILISMQDADNPAAITSASEFTSASRTTANTAWNDIANWTTGNDYNSPDFASAVQEVVDRGGWASGNAMTVFCDYVSSTNYRSGAPYEDATYTEPRLVIDYTAGGGGGASIPICMYHYKHHLRTA